MVGAIATGVGGAAAVLLGAALLGLLAGLGGRGAGSTSRPASRRSFDGVVFAGLGLTVLHAGLAARASSFVLLFAAPGYLAAALLFALRAIRRQSRLAGATVRLASLVGLALLVFSVWRVGELRSLRAAALSPPELRRGAGDLDLSDRTWPDAFGALCSDLAARYPLTRWKGVDWPRLRALGAPRIAAAAAAGDRRAYYRVLRDFAWSIPDGHVALAGDDGGLRQAEIGGDFGLRVVQLADGRVLACTVAPGGSAARAGLRDGAEILAWQGQPIERALAAMPWRWADRPPATAEARRADQLRLLAAAPPGARAAVRFRQRAEMAVRDAILTAGPADEAGSDGSTGLTGSAGADGAPPLAAPGVAGAEGGARTLLRSDVGGMAGAEGGPRRGVGSASGKEDYRSRTDREGAAEEGGWLGKCRGGTRAEAWRFLGEADGPRGGDSLARSGMARLAGEESGPWFGIVEGVLGGPVVWCWRPGLGEVRGLAPGGRGGELGRVAQGVGYIRIDYELPTLRQPSLSGPIGGALRDFQRRARGGTFGVVLDVRGNGGGIDAMVSPALGYFLQASRVYEIPGILAGPASPAVNATGLVPLPARAVLALPRQPWVRGRIAVLVDGNTGSAGEGVPLGLRGEPNVAIFGFAATGGYFALGQRAIHLPGGLTLFVPVGASLGADRRVQVDGDAAGRGGIVPDHRIPWTTETFDAVFRDHRDIALEAAAAWVAAGR